MSLRFTKPFNKIENPFKNMFSLIYKNSEFEHQYKLVKYSHLRMLIYSIIQFLIALLVFFFLYYKTYLPAKEANQLTTFLNIRYIIMSAMVGFTSLQLIICVIFYKCTKEKDNINFYQINTFFFLIISKLLMGGIRFLLTYCLRLNSSLILVQEKNINF